MDGSLQPLTVAVAQPPCRPGDVALNAVWHADAIREADARVVVFPELSLTGYELDAQPIPPYDPRLMAIVDACSESESYALVGAPVRDASGRCYIAFLAIDSGGPTVAYRKISLHGQESEYFTAGTEPTFVSVDGWRLGLGICRDTSAVTAARAAKLGIHAYIAGVLDHAADASVADDRSRHIAAHHRLWVATASFAGSTGGFDPAAGRSGIWGPDGELSGQAGPDVGEIVRGTLTTAASAS